MELTLEGIHLKRTLEVMTCKIDSEKFDFKEFYEQTHGKAYNFALKHCRTETLAEEVLQVAYLKLWQKHQEIHPTFPAFQSYLYTTIRNLIIKEYHRKVAERQASLVFQDLLEDARPEEETTALIQEIERILSTLPPKQQRAFQLIKFKGYTYSEAAEALCISESTIEKHIIKVLRSLRNQLHHITYLLLLLQAFFNIYLTS